MPKMSEAERLQKIEQARQMYCKGFDAQTIADIMTLAVRTVESWIRTYDFEKSKRSQIIALSEIRNSVLESYADVLDGKTPKISADQAVKYANAFEKFSSKKQVLSYMHEAYEMLTDEYMREIQKEQTPKKREQLLAELRSTRAKMTKVLTKLTKEVLGDE